MGSLLLALIYICFISLGLPDSLLGSAWPVLHAELGVPVSFAGIISLVISLNTIISSLLSDKLLHRFGAGKVTAVSVAMTAAALFGFSVSKSFWLILLLSIPYGLGAGGVDAVLNNYVAIHYKPQHMSWLHCMWGLGASVSPYIMSFALVRLERWDRGYLFVSLIQIALTAVIFLSLPLWKKKSAEKQMPEPASSTPPMRIRDVFKIKGAVPCFLTFFCYCSLEISASLWASSFLVETRGIEPETAAGFASMFYIGITLGRGINGFLAMKFKDKTLIRGGSAIILVGIALMLVPRLQITALAAFTVIGLGCAPIYPCIIHMTPYVFGADKSQAMIGIQMAFAYTGFMIMPPLFGVIADYINISLLPLFLAVLFVGMVITHEMVAAEKNKAYKS
jgi:fucose permease